MTGKLAWFMRYNSYSFCVEFKCDVSVWLAQHSAYFFLGSRRSLEAAVSSRVCLFVLIGNHDEKTHFPSYYGLTAVEAKKKRRCLRIPFIAGTTILIVFVCLSVVFWSVLQVAVDIQNSTDSQTLERLILNSMSL